MPRAVPLLICDRCGRSLYVKINALSEGDSCMRTIVPAEYEGSALLRFCPGTLRKPPKR